MQPPVFTCPLSASVYIYYIFGAQAPQAADRGKHLNDVKHGGSHPGHIFKIKIMTASSSEASVVIFLQLLNRREATCGPRNEITTSAKRCASRGSGELARLRKQGMYGGNLLLFYVGEKMRDEVLPRRDSIQRAHRLQRRRSRRDKSRKRVLSGETLRLETSRWWPFIPNEPPEVTPPPGSPAFVPPSCRISKAAWWGGGDSITPAGITRAGRD